MQRLPFAELVKQATDQLAGKVDNPRFEAEILLAGVIDEDRSYIIAHPDYVLNDLKANEFRARVSGRLRGEPYAYVVKQQEFWSIPLTVSKDVLIPRPETEVLVEQLLAAVPINEASTVLDLGTGSGAIACALKATLPELVVTAVDQSQAALNIAKQNAQKLGLDVTFELSDWFAELTDQTFDFIVANPPYIAEGDPHLLDGDVQHEPTSALVSGTDGLDDLRHIIAHAPQHLTTDNEECGRLLVEHGYDQAAAVRQLFTDAGFVTIKQHLDLAGHTRATSGRVAAV